MEELAKMGSKVFGEPGGGRYHNRADERSSKYLEQAVGDCEGSRYHNHVGV